MFFPQRITQIKSNDRVLEIGPGADPHPRSDVFLELKLDNDKEYERQFGHERKLETNKPVVFYDGITFPFADKEFDYVICSHVLEHVPDIPGFLAEVFRVAKQGYFEYPLITYEYQFNIDAHISYLKWKDGKILYMNKSETALNNFKPVQQALFTTLVRGYTQAYQKIPWLYIEGFEWGKPFAAEKVNSIELLVPDASEVPVLEINLTREYTAKTLLKALAGKFFRR
jgi:SAM-dependent methyltransferase